jgi:hypothetical protein
MLPLAVVVVVMVVARLACCLLLLGPPLHDAGRNSQQLGHGHRQSLQLGV